MSLIRDSMSSQIKAADVNAIKIPGRMSTLDGITTLSHYESK